MIANNPSRGDRARADYLRGRIALERGDERAALAAWKTLDLGTVTKAQVREIAQTKMTDLNANDIDAAMRMIEGTARSMGIGVEG